MLGCVATIVIGVVSVVFVIREVYKRSSGVCTCKNQLDGKTVIITGATAGIGKEAALDLASRGARVILASRDMIKAEKTRAWIVSSTGNKNIVTRHLELSDLDSVRKFVEETLKIETRLDILINNAGIFTWDQKLSKQGYELTLATNHYGSFLLTNLLLDLLKKSAPSRIINVSSSAHTYFHLSLEDLHFKERNFVGLDAYSQSKLCNVLFTKEMAHRLTNKGITNVTSNVLHPGAVKTEVFSKEKSFMAYIFWIMSRLVFKDSKLGAQTIIHLAVSDKVAKVTGEYFVDCKITETSKKALDPVLAKELWEVSEDEVGLTPEEKLI